MKENNEDFSYFEDETISDTPERNRGRLSNLGKKVLAAVALGVTLGATVTAGVKMEKDEYEKHQPKTKEEWEASVDEEIGTYGPKVRYSESGSIIGVELGNSKITIFDDNNNGYADEMTVYDSSKPNGRREIAFGDEEMTLKGAIVKASKN